MEQFEIKELIPIHIGDLNLSFTNSSLWMVLGVFFVALLMIGSTSGRSVVPGRWQAMAEMAYEFVAKMVRENVGQDGRAYFPFVFTLFMFILFGNLLGMLPYSFTFTSHIIVTFTMAFLIFLAVTVLGFIKHGLGFLRLFAPAGVPAPVLVILVPIEVMSYFIRPVSHSVRLFANMLAGHAMLKVFGMFVIMLGVFGVAPLVVIIALTGLEFLIAFLQAYVFAILTCIYLHDAMHPGH